MVTVKCRHCSAEIAVDATEPTTQPSNEAPEAPRRGPAPPPRPKGASVTKMGLGLPAPPLAGKSATATPLASATATPSPRGASATPHARVAAPKPAAVDDLWDDDDKTLLFNTAKPAPAPAKPHPHPPHPARKEEEPELVEAEEIPASSSDVPTLDPHQLQAARPEPPPKRVADDFSVNLSPGMQGILGAPTIDVSHLDDAIPVPSAELVELEPLEEDVDFQLSKRSGRGGTMPLFDMSAVLPASSNAQPNASSQAVTRAQTSDAPASVSLPAPENKARERKFVIAPESPAGAPKARRAGAVIWFVLVAAAAGVVAVVGLRGHQSGPPPQATEPPALEPPTPPAPNESAKTSIAEHAPDDVGANTPSAPPADVASTTAKATPSPAPSPASTATPITKNVSAEVKPESAPEKPALSPPPAEAVEKPSSAPALDKPVTPSKPTEVHNAPPPAADGTEFDRAAARNALASAAAQASSCRKDGDPSGMATITITFAPSGRITSANLQGPPFAGTATGGCIANTMRRATVPAFSGEYVTVTKTIVVE